MSSSDSLFYQKSLSNSVAIYHRNAGDQSGLYNGSQYAAFPNPFKDGFPFFKTDHAGQGSVVYDDINYDNVLLQYDEVSDVLVLQDGSKNIQLISQRIRSFTLFGNKFIRIIKDSSSAELISSGFYNFLYDGATTVLKKETKNIREDISTEKVIYLLDPHVYHYIKKEGEFHAVTGRRSLLRLLPEKRKEIQQFIRKNKLNYHDDPDELLRRCAAFYDSLTTHQ